MSVPVLVSSVFCEVSDAESRFLGIFQVIPVERSS